VQLNSAAFPRSLPQLGLWCGANTTTSAFASWACGAALEQQQQQQQYFIELKFTYFLI
jgi:hypothetical protein